MDEIEEGQEEMEEEVYTEEQLQMMQMMQNQGYNQLEE